MKKFLRVYGSGLLVLGPVLIVVGLTDPSASAHRFSPGVFVGLNSLIVGGWMLLMAHRRQ